MRRPQASGDAPPVRPLRIATAKTPGFPERASARMPSDRPARNILPAASPLHSRNTVHSIDNAWNESKMQISNMIAVC